MTSQSEMTKTGDLTLCEKYNNKYNEYSKVYMDVESNFLFISILARLFYGIWSLSNFREYSTVYKKTSNNQPLNITWDQTNKTLVSESSGTPYIIMTSISLVE